MRIQVPGADSSQDMARDLNRVVKEHTGKNRAFVMVMVNEGGDALVLSNMDVIAQRIDLLAQVCNGLQGKR